MNRTSITVLLALSSLATVGCASKNYVRQETTPLINKTNELDDMTAKNSHDIKDVDSRSQAGIQQVQTKASEADQKAQAAGQQADQAQTSANNASNRVDALQTTIANLDNYRVVNQASVQFGFDKDILTKDGKDALDQLVTNVPNTKGYIITVEGATDSTGDAEDKPIESNQTREGRAKNRRVDVRLMTNSDEGGGTPAATASKATPPGQ
jgi:OOP family OmpA-OmpF porin